MSTNAKRLADAVRNRREELDLNQMEVWQAGGPSNTVLTRIENGKADTPLARGTYKKLDAGLRWAPGSAKGVHLQGEPPMPMPRGMTRGGARMLRQQIVDSDIDPALRERLLGILDDDEGRRGA